MPKVSVIIPAYNASDYIAAAINSVLRQTFKDYEIIVVNDGSTDNTVDVLKPFMSRIRYIYQDNKGEKGAKNTGIKLAEGEYIALLDSDDLWMEDKLERQVPILDESGPEVGIIHTDYWSLWKDMVNNKSAFQMGHLPPNQFEFYLYLLHILPEMGTYFWLCN